MGTLEKKIEYFSGAVKWLEVEGRYIPDVYHTILHILILAVVITSAIYIRNSKKAMLRLMIELNKGFQSGEQQGWKTEEDLDRHFAEKRRLKEAEVEE